MYDKYLPPKRREISKPVDPTGRKVYSLNEGERAALDRAEEAADEEKDDRPPINRLAIFTDSSPNYQFPNEPEPFSKVTVRIRVGRDDVDTVTVVADGKAHTMKKREDLATAYFDFYEATFHVDMDRPGRQIHQEPRRGPGGRTCRDPFLHEHGAGC